MIQRTLTSYSLHLPSSLSCFLIHFPSLHHFHTSIYMIAQSCLVLLYHYTVRRMHRIVGQAEQESDSDSISIGDYSVILHHLRSDTTASGVCIHFLFPSLPSPLLLSSSMISLHRTGLSILSSFPRHLVNS